MSGAWTRFHDRAQQAFVPARVLEKRIRMDESDRADLSILMLLLRAPTGDRKGAARGYCVSVSVSDLPDT